MSNQDHIYLHCLFPSNLKRGTDLPVDLIRNFSSYVRQLESNNSLISATLTGGAILKQFMTTIGLRGFRAFRVGIPMTSFTYVKAFSAFSSRVKSDR